MKSSVVIERLPNSPWCDANAEFARASNYRDFERPGDDAPRYPVLLQLSTGCQVADIRGLGVKVPAAYPDDARLAVAWPDPQQYDALRLDAWDGRVQRWELQIPVVPLRPAIAWPTKAGLSLGVSPMRRRPTRTVIGVFDDGCPFADLRFADTRDGRRTSRFFALWAQGDEFFQGIADRRTPHDFGRGTELFANEIEALLNRCCEFDGSVDEAAVYRRCGYAQAPEGFVHGIAHVGLLASPLPLSSRYPTDEGDDQRPPRWNAVPPDEASTADIIFVQPPRRAVEDSTSATLPMQLVDGIRYMMSRAAGASRLVVSIADGTSRALHDGNALVEDAIRDLIAEAAGTGLTLQVVVAAGNAYAQARHAVLVPKRRPSKAGRVGRDVAMLRLGAGNEQPSFLNVAMPPAARLLISPPRRFKMRPFEVAPGRLVTFSMNGEACGWFVVPHAGPVTTQALLAWSPTATRPDGFGSCPAGDWRIQALGEPGDELRLWISLAQKNLRGPSSFRQARFIDADLRYDPTRFMRPQPFDTAPASVIRRLDTLSVPATMGDRRSVFAVGADTARVPSSWPSRYFPDGGETRSAYSSVGASVAVPSDRRPADFTHAQAGVRAGGSPSGQVLAVTGTSFATPQVARDRVNGP